MLFTDADIAWRPGALRDLVRAAEADDRDLVSQMALLRTATGWERVVVPAFVYFFAQLYPFGRVNSPRSRTAAAAGGCMLVRREALERSGGLAPIRGARIDDVALGQVIKGQRGRCWLGLSTEVVSVRPYPRLADLWQMVARSAYIQLRYSPWLLAGTVAGLAFIYLLPPAGAITGLAALAASAASAARAPAALAAGAGLAGWALMSLTYLPMLRLYRLSPLRAPGLPLIALLYTAMTVDSARRHYAGRGAEWKGRTDPRPVRLCCVTDPNEAGANAAGANVAGASDLWADDPGTGWRRYIIADVFTATPLEGNPLAVFPDGRGLGVDVMQRMARELNLSETVFFLPAEHAADVRVRIFTPANELTFAGHPVLGSAFVLGEALGTSALTLETGAGPIPVELERNRGQIVFGRMEQPVPVPEPYEDTDALLAALGVTRSGLPVEAYRNGPRHVYVELPSEAEVAALWPDQRALGHLPVAVSTFAGQGPAWKTRMFSPFHGVPEDPATGSAAGPLAVHLARHGRIGFGEEIEIRQGEEIGRPSRLYARAEGSADKVERVLVGGSAVIVARGEYRLS